MSITIRPMRDEDARAFLDIHTRSIRGLAAPYYPPEVLNSWTGPITDVSVARFLRNPHGEIRLMAELDGVAVGVGCLVVSQSELRACYVAPEAARKGVGTALVKEIERIARENGLLSLRLDASINAEPFYAALGYEVVERGEHVWSSGERMAAVMMRKVLAVPGGVD